MIDACANGLSSSSPHGSTESDCRRPRSSCAVRVARRGRPRNLSKRLARMGGGWRWYAIPEHEGGRLRRLWRDSGPVLVRRCVAAALPGPVPSNADRLGLTGAVGLLGGPRAWSAHRHVCRLLRSTQPLGKRPRLRLDVARARSREPDSVRIGSNTPHQPVARQSGPARSDGALRARTVTVARAVAPGSAVDPDDIVDRYLGLHFQPTHCLAARACLPRARRRHRVSVSQFVAASTRSAT